MEIPMAVWGGQTGCWQWECLIGERYMIPSGYETEVYASPDKAKESANQWLIRLGKQLGVKLVGKWS